jgi:hypothetical protein
MDFPWNIVFSLAVTAICATLISIVPTTPDDKPFGRLFEWLSGPFMEENPTQLESRRFYIGLLVAMGALSGTFIIAARQIGMGAFSIICLAVSTLCGEIAVWCAYKLWLAKINRLCAGIGFLFVPVLTMVIAYYILSCPDVLRFDSFMVNLGNMPERKAVKNTWDGDVWHESIYYDLRLELAKTLPDRIENLDLTISIPEDKKDRHRPLIAAIDQISDIPDVQFIKPNNITFTATIPDGNGGKIFIPFSTHVMFPKGWGVPPVQSTKIFVTKLLDDQEITLIIGTIPAIGPAQTIAKALQLSGTYEVVLHDKKCQKKISQLVIIRQP